MPSTINIAAVLIANVMGLAILFVVAVGNFWRQRENSKEDRCLFVMFICTAMNCIVDPLCFIADGRAGLLNRIIVIGCNTLLYLGGMVTALMWIYLVANHLKIKLSSLHNTILKSVVSITFLMVIANLFIPILFTVDENNVYSRLGGFWIHQTMYIVYILDGVILYLRRRYLSGGLKFFPVWAFIVPATIGILIQVMFYGVSTATPFTTVSIVCVILCLQNEFMFRDMLTGLYNRFYLNTVEKRLLRYPNLKYTAVMLDINGFKKINDTYGHKVGDEALIHLGSVLSEAVDKIGEIVRYAGDEFIIILNTQDDACLEGVISKINVLLDKFNNEEHTPYKILISTGYCKLDISKTTMDEYMDAIDKLMYENKQKFYNEHIRYER